jgi:hypothetical protein
MAFPAASLPKVPSSDLQKRKSHRQESNREVRFLRHSRSRPICHRTLCGRQSSRRSASPALCQALRLICGSGPVGMRHTVNGIVFDWTVTFVRTVWHHTCQSGLARISGESGEAGIMAFRMGTCSTVPDYCSATIQRAV